MTSRIVWSEGMFIAPQHFQYADEMGQTYADQLIQLNLVHGAVGFSQLEINLKVTALGDFSLINSAGILTDRTYFNADTEVQLSVPDGVVDQIIYLALPIVQRGVEQFGDIDDGRRFVISERQLQDQHNCNNDRVATNIGRLNVRLMLQQDDATGYCQIAVARILEKSSDGRLILDQNYIPQVLRIGASTLIMQRLEEIIALTRLRANNASTRIMADVDTLSETSLWTERLELQTLNKALLVLQNAYNSEHTAPRDLFISLASLLVDLEAIGAQTTDHQLLFHLSDLTACFNPLFAALRQRLTLEKSPNVLALEWNAELFEKRRLMRLVVTPTLLAQNRRPVLALRQINGTDNLQKIGPLACKLASLSSMPELISRGLEGIPIQSLSYAPPELRHRSDATFFSIDTQCSAWLKYVNSREALALHIDDRISEVEVTLYLVD
ncbi:MAG: type VI secretion system baseplate subunit TssK [Amylibacter sp.]|nr:type VI secretion system baseplate subunit TssK [Amylibacter sp.]